MSAAVTIPPGVRVLTEGLTINGWSYTLNHANDDDGHAYISIEGRRGNDLIAVMWHAQQPGTYCEVNWHEATFTKVMQAVAA